MYTPLYQYTTTIVSITPQKQCNSAAHNIINKTRGKIIKLRYSTHPE